jgi:hypothetical protein
MAYLTEYPGDLAGLATILGHSSLDITRIYANPTTDQLRQRMEDLALNAYGHRAGRLTAVDIKTYVCSPHSVGSRCDEPHHDVL